MKASGAYAKHDEPQQGEHCGEERGDHQHEKQLVGPYYVVGEGGAARSGAIRVGAWRRRRCGQRGGRGRGGLGRGGLAEAEAVDQRDEDHGAELQQEEHLPSYGRGVADSGQRGWGLRGRGVRAAEAWKRRTVSSRVTGSMRARMRVTAR